MLAAQFAGEGWDSHGGGTCDAQQGLQLQEVQLPQEVLRVLPGLHLLLRELQVRGVPKLQCEAHLFLFSPILRMTVDPYL